MSGPFYSDYPEIKKTQDWKEFQDYKRFLKFKKIYYEFEKSKLEKPEVIAVPEVIPEAKIVEKKEEFGGYSQKRIKKDENGNVIMTPLLKIKDKKKMSVTDIKEYEYDQRKIYYQRMIEKQAQKTIDETRKAISQ
jgi:hypothetical protein